MLKWKGIFKPTLTTYKTIRFNGSTWLNSLQMPYHLLLLLLVLSSRIEDLNHA